MKAKKLIYGFGTNDGKHPVSYIDKKKDKRVMCPYYVKWVSMLYRCYSSAFHKKQPTYSKMSVSDEWAVFSNFRAWMVKQDWKNKELDKDIKYPGNTCYSKDTCIFVTKEINTLLSDSKKARGKYPQGVSYFKRDSNYKAQIKMYGKQIHIGYADTEQAAELLYLTAKILHIEEIAKKEIDIEVVKGLNKHKKLLKTKRSTLC